jgi:hypothetical protein
MQHDSAQQKIAHYWSSALRNCPGNYLCLAPQGISHQRKQRSLTWVDNIPIENLASELVIQLQSSTNSNNCRSFCPRFGNIMAGTPVRQPAAALLGQKGFLLNLLWLNERTCCKL